MDDARSAEFLISTVPSMPHRVQKTKRTSSADFLFFNRLERGVGTLGCHDHMAGMGNFVLGNLADLISQQRDDGEGFAGKGHEFNRATFAAFVNEHDRADVILG